jgi:hypothetical protein
MNFWVLPAKRLGSVAATLQDPKKGGFCVCLLWVSDLILDPTEDSRFTTRYAGSTENAGVGLEQLLVAGETLWDRGSQSEAILPLKIRNALAYRISRAKDSGGTELLMPS